MDEAIKYISKIEIKGLFGDDALRVWDLHPKVNILSGPNGSGKSTVLRYVYEVAIHEFIDHPYKIEDVILTFDNGQTLKFYEIDPYHMVDDLPSPQPPTKDKSPKLTTGLVLRSVKVPPVDFIKPLDNQLLSIEAVQKLSDERVKTDLDWLLYKVQQKYLRYQIHIGKIVHKLAENNGSKMQERLQEISRPKAKFIEIINDVFAYTDKKINEETDDISFFIGDKSISAYDLSSGEKQILIILLTTLTQEQKPTILIMDEPEISIHFDVQKKLISYIRELNPNVQIILATHSPAIIMDGWMDNVSEISDLIVHDNQEAVLENAE